MFVSLGGGNFKQSGWINVDYPFKKRAYKQDRKLIDISHNFMKKKPLPIKTESVHAVYTEHCIEHLTYDAVQYLLQDVYRILIPGGPLRISCPDATVLYEMYGDKSRKHIEFNHKRRNDHKAVELLDAVCSPLIDQLTVEEINKIYTISTSCEMFFETMENKCFIITAESQMEKPGHHLTWWTSKRLKTLLKNIGFRKIKFRNPRESKIELFKSSYIDTTAPQFSIRVECGK